MPDNVGYTPGSGATIAADDVGGALYQRVKIAVGADGSASDATSTNPIPVAGYGELIEVLEQIRTILGSLMGTVGASYPDVFGRLRVVTDSASSINAVGTVTTVTGVTSVTTLAVLNQLSNYRADYVPRQLSNLSADNLRRNITVT